MHVCPEILNHDFLFLLIRIQVIRLDHFVHICIEFSEDFTDDKHFAPFNWFTVPLMPLGYMSNKWIHVHHVSTMTVKCTHYVLLSARITIIFFPFRKAYLHIFISEIQGSMKSMQ